MAVPASVPKATPTAVAPSASGGVDINSRPQRGPYKAPTGSSYVPAVPRRDDHDPQMPTQPAYGGGDYSMGGAPNSGGGAPSVPGLGGVLFTPGPIDAHYLSPAEAVDPYRRVNSPPTRGMVTFVKGFLNHVFNGRQNVDNAGWQQNSPQQRTSYMRVTPPPLGAGYVQQWFTPRQLPQSDATYKYPPAIGTDAPGVRILNSSSFGAGQTAGGVGGNQYTPQPGPPPTTSTAGGMQDASGMPTWG